MAVPVIDPTTSVLAFRRGEFFVYQPAATNTPTSWTCAGLPTGVSINGTTGKISGAATQPGFYNCALYAINGTGTSTPAFFLAIGIEGVPFGVDAFTELNVDIPSGRVSNPGLPAAKDGEPVVFTKKGDWLLLSIGHAKAGILQALSRERVDIAIKEYMSERVLVITEGSFELVGSFDTERAKIAVKMDADVLASVLSNYPSPDDKNNVVDAAAEIRIGLQYIKPGDTDPSILEITSQNFILRIAEDIAPDID